MSFRALLLASILALGACDLRPADFSGLERSSERFNEAWSKRVAEIQAAQQALVARLQQLPTDTAGFAESQAQLASVSAMLEEIVKTKLPAVQADLRTRIDQKQRTLAEEALRHGSEDLRAAVGEATTLLAAQRKVVSDLETAAAQKKSEPPPDGSVADIVNPAFARQQGSQSDVPGITFKPDTAELDMEAPETNPALMRIIALTAVCQTIRLEITAHTAKNGDAKLNERLSAAQAEAVRAHLIASGVAPEKLAKVSGVGGTRPAVPEPDAGSPEEQAMDTDALAKIRARNRRISVKVLEACPAAEPV